jgi:hypothetical protein
MRRPGPEPRKSFADGECSSTVPGRKPVSVAVLEPELEQDLAEQGVGQAEGPRDHQT